MKTLWVAVMLSFVSVCQPAPLTCDKLTMEVKNSPELSGRWYYIAISTKVCLPAVFINSVFWPSVAIDIASKGTPNLYAATATVKMYGICINETLDFFHENSKFYDVNTENTPVGEPDVLLQTSCSDCIVVKGTDTSIDTLSLLSRRKTISEAELKEFETQAQCNQFSKPQILNTDLDFNNCLDMDNMSEDHSLAFLKSVYERVKSSHQHIFNCLSNIFLTYINEISS